MKELDDFTVERLQQIAVFPPSQAEAAALARIALAAKTAEPVAFQVGDRLFNSLYAAGCYSSEMKIAVVPLYRESMPNSPELPDGWIKCSERMPPDGEDVVCAAEFFGPGDWRRKVGHSRKNGEWRVYGASWTPSHWQPLPPPPTTEK